MKYLKNNIYGLLGLARRAGKISFGTESSMEAIEKRKAKFVIVAKDASDRTKKIFENIAQEKNIPFRIAGTIEEISNSIGQINKAVVTVNDENFSKEILKRIDGGEIIG